jgi:hypothetical protein
MRLCRPGAVLLSISLVAVTGIFTMNIISMLKQQRRRARQSANTHARLLAIPESSIAGISTLPIELWGVIIEYLTIEELGDARIQCGNLFVLLERRLVCRKFLTSRSQVETLTRIRHFQ